MLQFFGENMIPFGVIILFKLNVSQCGPSHLEKIVNYLQRRRSFPYMDDFVSQLLINEKRMKRNIPTVTGYYMVVCAQSGTEVQNNRGCSRIEHKKLG